MAAEPLKLRGGVEPGLEGLSHAEGPGIGAHLAISVSRSLQPHNCMREADMCSTVHHAIPMHTVLSYNMHQRIGSSVEDLQPGLAVEMRSNVLKLQEEMHKAEVGSHSWSPVH